MAASSSAAAATTQQGRYVSVELKYLGDKSKNEPDEPMKLYDVPDRGRYVEAINDKPYGIFVRNLAQETLCFKLLIDGHTMTTRCVHRGTATDITRIVVSSRTVGDRVMETTGGLVFKNVEIAEGQTLDRQVASASIQDKLGSIEIEVWNTIITEPKPVRHTVVNEQSKNTALQGPVSAAEGKKKGAFRTATGFGGVKEESSYTVSTRTSRYCFGYNKYETVTVRYASRALLLLMGTPPQLFMKANQNQNQGPIELSDEDEKPKTRPIKRQRGTEASAAALSSSTTTAGSASSSSSTSVKQEVKKEVKKEASAPVMLTILDDDDESSHVGWVEVLETMGDEPTLRGQYMEVTIKQKKSRLFGWYETHTTMKKYNVPGKADPYVESVVGEESPHNAVLVVVGGDTANHIQHYGIVVRNLTNQTLVYKVFVDGLEIAYYYCLPNNTSSIIDDMITHKTVVGEEIKEVLQKLVFKQAMIDQEGTTLDRAVAQADDRLGRIDIQVYDSKPSIPLPAARNVVDVKALDGAVGPADGRKKGAFKTATGRGEKSEVTYKQADKMSSVARGPNHLETLTVRYASKAMLLLLGVPPYVFMNAINQQHAQGKVINLAEDDRPKKRARAPATNAAASSSGAVAAGSSTNDDEVVFVEREVKTPVLVNVDDSDEEGS